MKKATTATASHSAVRRTARQKGRARAAGQTSCRRPEYITDPEMLLQALERGEAREAAPFEPRAVASCHAPAPVARAPEAPASGELPRDVDPIHALPVLRDDERIGRASSEGVVVIIRRRRAA